ncbi:hypothetical protein FXO38_24292 [Capsicum annuum]|nr:hypothetical protein FXO37_33449 [Capsicum annuum]KAF3636214.1 hypothetical protein FXO38_24292 [Capsicum annuum]
MGHLKGNLKAIGTPIPIFKFSHNKHLGTRNPSNSLELLVEKGTPLKEANKGHFGQQDQVISVCSTTINSAVLEAAISVNSNLLTKPLMVRLNTLYHDVLSQSLKLVGEHHGESRQLVPSTENDKDLMKGEMSTPGWADLADGEGEVSPPLLNSKLSLSPGAPIFVPKSATVKKNELGALVSRHSPAEGYSSDLS